MNVNFTKTDKKRNHYQYILVKSVSFLLIGSLLFVSLQELLKPQWNSPKWNENITWAQESFYRQEADTEQVLFFGSSHMQYGMVPTQIYRNNGIISYNLGSSCQPIKASYYLLKATLQKQLPEVVVLDVSELFYDDREDSHWRFLIDAMPLTTVKWEFAASYANKEAQKYSDSWWERFWSAIIPMLQYHTRWNVLEDADFYNPYMSDHYGGGSYLTARVLAPSLTIMDMNYYAETMQKLSLQEIIYQNRQTDNHFVTLESNDLQEDLQEESLFFVLGENIQTLQEIKTLCEKNSVELLLVKVPSMGFPNMYTSSWSELRSLNMKKLAEELEIPFLDLLYDVDLGINWETDTFDGGAHLNYNGSQKVSAYLGDYLAEHYHLQPTQSDSYDQKLEIYHQVTEIASLEMEQHLLPYLQQLNQMKDRLVICMSVSDDMRSALDWADARALNSLGLQADFMQDLAYSSAYLAVIDGGQVLYEATSTQKLEKSIVLDDGTELDLVSSGFLSTPQASIKIGGTGYAMNARGLNLVIYDKESQTVVDSVAFDTWQSNDPAAMRTNANTETYLRNYERFLVAQNNNREEK